MGPIKMMDESIPVKDTSPAVPCSRCNGEPRLSGQRWGRKCMTEYERERRKRIKPKPIENPIHETQPLPLDQGPSPCGKGAQSGWPEGCGKPFPPKRNGQIYCCNGHGSGKRDHTPECSIKGVTQDLEYRARVISRKGSPVVSHVPIPVKEKRLPEKAKKKGRGTRPRWNPALIERTKQTILEIPKYPNRPEVIRISFIPYGQGYADVRVYLRGRHTRQGLVIHRDLIGEVIAGLKQALKQVF